MSFSIALYPGAQINLLDHLKSFPEYLISPILQVCPTVLSPECAKWVGPLKNWLLRGVQTQQMIQIVLCNCPNVIIIYIFVFLDGICPFYLQWSDI